MSFSGWFSSALIVAALQSSGGLPRGITIINTGKPIRLAIPTSFDAGFSTGEMLNNHLFPGVIWYTAGMYSLAAPEFTYVINRPQYLTGNPRRNEFLSMAYYLRGMTYLYHSSGVGRHNLAKGDFESALDMNPKNYVAQLELSRVYSELGFRDQATSILRRLLNSEPEEAIAGDAQKELDALLRKSPSPQAVPQPTAPIR